MLIFTKMPPAQQKKKEDRVKEAITLLRQIKDIGVLDTTDGYKKLKEVLDLWIRDGHAWTGKVKLEEYNRVADIVLPSVATAYASMRLRSV